MCIDHYIYSKLYTVAIFLVLGIPVLVQTLVDELNKTIRFTEQLINTTSHDAQFT